MAILNISEWQVSGDIGGLGISRFHWENAAHTAGSPADCNAAGAAISGFFGALRANYPNNITWSPTGTIASYDVATALVQSVQGYTAVPAAHTGLSNADYGAGLGARVNISTGVVVGRRLLRGALFFVPLGGDSYDSTDGGLSGATVGNIVAAYNTMSAAFVAAGLSLVVWHRPKKLSPGTGVAFTQTAVAVNKAPAGLRSRRS